jgi:4'-phosphopantetheinyl transferase
MTADQKFSSGFSSEWPVSSLPQTLGADEVHVWVWSLEATVTDRFRGLDLLSEEEKSRFEQLRFERDRERYVAAHQQLRQILGAYAGERPQDIRFDVDSYGKPALLSPHAHIQFNLSHSHTVAVVAVCRDWPVGVDVEDIQPIEPGVADSHFSAVELAQLRQFDGDAWLHGFYRCWTRKEAILKGEGVGLQSALDSFDVGLAVEAKLLGTRQQFQYPWTLRHLEPCPGVIGAVAVSSPGAKLRCFSA